MKKLVIYFVASSICNFAVYAQSNQSKEEQKRTWQRKFEQLGTELPTPNVYRTASGAPGEKYWQQRADYKISVKLNDQDQSISGTEQITYHNNSPDALHYLWLQLDQNVRAPNSDTPKTTNFVGALDEGFPDTISTAGLTRGFSLSSSNFVGGFKIDYIKDDKGNSLPYTINKTMMRVELPKALIANEKEILHLSWSYSINNRMEQGGRSGYEYFEEDKNYLYAIAQFYPRMAVYDDVEGWQNKQFLGQGEFALTFGDFEVSITVPSDHIVASTGELLNPKKVLSTAQISRLEEAKKSFDKTVFIVTEEEAKKTEIAPLTQSTNTWVFKADNVRDFAFASSRKFIWDAQAVKTGNKRPLAMSFYPKEGNPLWEKESTKAVVNALKIYSKYTIDYPYPVAISVHTASIGMEYPMICFNFGRPARDGTYSDQVKWRMIGVIIHEVGHNFFPMIINSDERQWTWMDEGLNSFVQSLTEIESYSNMPIRRGTPQTITRYMSSDKRYIRPIMTNSEQILRFNFGNNAYSKPSAALHVLRETVMGRELFDYALKEYARRWAFKHPSPADFFRTMEDASAVDLDWFWRGWFYSTDYVDVSVDNVRWFRVKSDVETRERPLLTEANLTDNTLTNPKEFTLVPVGDDLYNRTEFRDRYDEEFINKTYKDKNFYLLDFSNKGGMMTPIVLEWSYTDGSSEVEKIPVEVWRKDENRAIRLFVKDKQVRSVTVDPKGDLADISKENNVFPREKIESEVENFKERMK